MDNADSKILLGMNKEKKSETTVDQKKKIRNLKTPKNKNNQHQRPSKRTKTKTTNIKRRISNKSGNKSGRH